MRTLQIRNISPHFARTLAGTAAALVVFSVSAPHVSAQNASIGGTVMIDPTEKPLANAEIIITALKRSTRSDSAGNFLFTGLPAGRHEFVVRLVGYEASTAEVSLTGTQKFEADVLLKPTSTKLATVDVKGKANVDNGIWTIKLQEFEERRAMGIGRFLTKEEFEREEGLPASAFLLRKIPGLQFIRKDGHAFMASTRGGGQAIRMPMLSLPRACYMQIVVNGMVRWNGNGQQMFDIDALNSKDIIGFEFYTTATTPLQYNGTRGADAGACGTVIIWTKGG